MGASDPQAWAAPSGRIKQRIPDEVIRMRARPHRSRVARADPAD